MSAYDTCCYVLPAFCIAVVNISSTAAAASSKVLNKTNFGLTACDGRRASDQYRCVQCNTRTSSESDSMKSTSIGRGSLASTYICSEGLAYCVDNGSGAPYLEEGQEVVKLLLLRPSVETHADGVKNNTNQPDAEEVVLHVNRARLAGRRPTLGCARGRSASPDSTTPKRTQLTMYKRH